MDNGEIAPRAPKSVIASPEAGALIEWAQGVLKGYDGKRHSRMDALDWLLRDACEYGSPVVGAKARNIWRESVETKEWERKRMALKGSLSATPRRDCFEPDDDNGGFRQDG